MARSGLWYRRTLSELTRQPAAVRAVSGATAVLLVAGVLAAATRGPSSSPRRDAPLIASGAGGPGSVFTTTLAPNGQTTAVPRGAPSSPIVRRSGSPGGPSGPAPPGAPGPVGKISPAVARTLCGGPASGARLTASDRGVTPTSIKVAFPYFDSTGPTALTGTQQYKPENQSDFVQAYVDCINAAGGVGGRQINPIIQVVNPLDDTSMDAFCRKWAQDDQVFAVLDAETWFGPHQLCLTQDNQTPLVSGLSQTSEIGRQGAPYLWWTSPSDDQDIDNLVLWANAHGLFSGQRVGVVTTDRAIDQSALKQHMLPDLNRLGIRPADVETFSYDRGQAEAQATVAAEKLKTAGVQVILPMLAFDSFAFWLVAAQNQQFIPKYLLSDFELMIATAGVFGDHFPAAFQGAEGPTFSHLGETGQYPSDYDANELRCVAIWKAEHPGTELAVNGTNMRWCDVINTFVEGALRAGPDLTRVGWAKAMATINNLGAATTPVLSYGPGRFWGPTEMKAVKILTSGCPAQYAQSGSGTCWVPLDPYGPMRQF